MVTLLLFKFEFQIQIQTLFGGFYRFSNQKPFQILNNVEKSSNRVVKKQLSHHEIV